MKLARWLMGALMLSVLLLLALGIVWAPDKPVSMLTARWATPPSRFLALDGMQVHLRDEGPRIDSVPLVLVHGTSASLHTWDGWAAALRGSRRVIRFDRPSIGRRWRERHADDVLGNPSSTEDGRCLKAIGGDFQNTRHGQQATSR